LELVNRDTENHISAVLSAKQMAPIYFGRFQNGRLEEFRENVRPLKHVEMKQPVICREIARQLGKFHRMISCNDLYHPTIGSDDGGDGDNDHHCHDHNDKNPTMGSGEIWKRVDDWIGLAHSLYQDDYGQLSCLLGEISREWQWLKGEIMEESNHLAQDGSSYNLDSNPDDDLDHDLDGMNKIQNLAIKYCRELVFAHMDCQSLNILTPLCINHDDHDNNNNKDDENIHLQLIDFEYSGMNPRAADIGNTFCEFCDMNNLAPDYAKEYPSTSVQDMFLLSYIRANNESLAKSIQDGMKQDEKDLFLSTMRQEIGKHSLISHLGWAVWALVQNKVSSIEFDYIRYSEIRMEGYFMFKNQLFV